ncbi:hypothetical protein L207DRAFT_415893 [Hyaloscypha variabilis F]|uniref:Uncharacterized protein n=1 Tax=Hyaloscypha variabilis (strain UAMH 11265 / GT02V1 / F) TaxID=1149755 RepID=A0A2J6S9N7_HYAVF|nr:hypothetical protein L207DRAFT_415893 [Hyaloscypha variabilis F]
MLSSKRISAHTTSTYLHSTWRVSTAILRQAGSLPRSPRLQSQRRNFRLGLWSSYLDPNFQKEVRRRHRVVKHKYIEALNRRLSWDRHSPVHTKHLGLKSFMCSAWRGQDPRPGGRWVDVDELFGNKERTQKGTDKGIEDVEQSAVEKLFRNQDVVYDYIRARSSRLWAWNEPASNASNESHTTANAPYTSPSSVYDLEGFRKRFQTKQDFKPSSDLEYVIDPITNRKVFRNKSNDSAESGRKPINIPVKTFKGYRSQFQERQEGKDNLRILEANKEERTSSKVYDPAPGFEEYDRKVDYKSGQFYNPASIKTNDLDQVQKGLQDYDDSISSKIAESIKPAEHNTEVSEKVDSVQDGLREYDRKVDYGSGQFYKCTGKNIDYTHPDQAGLKEYDEKISNGESMSSQSDAKPHNLSETDGWQEYDSQVDYKSGQFYEPSGSAIDYSDPIQGGLRDYDGKISRQALQQGDRNGKTSCDPVEDALKDYDTRTNYGPKGAIGIPMQRGGILGRVRSLYNEMKEDLDLLRASDVRAGSGIVKKPTNETESEKLAKRKQLENDFKDRQENTLSSADEMAAAEKVRQSRKLVEDLRVEHSELQNHAAHARSRINAKLAEVEAGWSSPKKMTGNFVRDFPEEFETSWTIDQSSSGSLMPTKILSNLNSEEAAENNVQREEHEYVSGMAPSTARIEPSLDRTTAIRLDKDASTDDGHGAKEAQVPESSSKEELQNDKNRRKESDRNLIQEVRKIYEDTYGTIDSKHRQVEIDANPGVEPNNCAESVASEPTSANAEPTLYKILAYDPTMQSISTAETTSIVTDSSGTLTPAEVLLRLSNPSKFFPHFQPLQAEGYEIVSGSGDVLVFRKVRSGAPKGASIVSKPIMPEKVQNYKATNPIDGMQSSPVAATGNFASPTGFVNHDFPGVSEPPFKSNIDVRREEPVFSGKRNWEDGSESSRPKGRGKFKKVLVGGAWVAAASYAVGVVAEFFKTGGADGKGPEGF